MAGKTCQAEGCGKITEKGYSKSIFTGAESKSTWFCDECFERGLQREANNAAYFYARKEGRDTKEAQHRRESE